MKRSIRLHHPYLKAPPDGRLNYVVEMPQRYETPYNCNACKMTHEYKAIHLRLDEYGDVFVAPGIYELLKTVGLAGLEFANELDNAPAQFVGAVELLKTETVTSNGHRFWTPGQTRYESRDFMQKPFLPILEAFAEKADRKATAEKAEKQRTFILGRRRD
jgi:hypothetical protein